MAEMKIVRQAQITCPQDFVDLNIVDWNRFSYGSMFEAMNNLPKWLTSCWYTIVDCDIRNEPLLEGFEWKHSGHHVPVGHRYWSNFKRRFPTSEIEFGDSPDFMGRINFSDGDTRKFFGDIGVVSASCFFLDVVPLMESGDLWISVEETHQTIIEASYDIQKAVGMYLEKAYCITSGE